MHSSLTEAKFCPVMCWHGQFQQIGSTDLKQQQRCCRGSLGRGKEQAGQSPNLEVYNTHLLTSPSAYHPCCGNEAKNKTQLPPFQFRVNCTCPGRIHCLQLPTPVTQHSCLVAEREERGACSPSTTMGHRLASLFKLLGAVKFGHTL